MRLGVRVGPRVSIFTRPALVWALRALWALSRGRYAGWTAMSPLAYVRKIASTPSTFPDMGEGRNLGISLCDWDLRRCGTGRDMRSLRVDHISRDFLYNHPTYPLGKLDVVSA